MSIAVALCKSWPLACRSWSVHAFRKTRLFTSGSFNLASTDFSTRFPYHLGLSRFFSSSQSSLELRAGCQISCDFLDCDVLRVMLPLNAVMIFQWNLSYHHHHHPAFRAALSLWSSAFSPWAQSGRRCVRDRCRFIKKQLPVSSKRATEWEIPPPTPQMPAASAGAAAVAVPGKEKHSTESHTSTHRFIHWWLKSSH